MDASGGGQSVATESKDESIGAEQGLSPQTASSMTTARQKLLWRMAIVLANVDYFEELSARLAAGQRPAKKLWC
jgi:hypothetical protein